MQICRKNSKTQLISDQGRIWDFLEGGFQKNFECFVDFFLVEQIVSPSSLKALERFCFEQFFCATGKKQAKKGVIRHFLAISYCVFFRARYPLKTGIYCHRICLQNNFRVHQSKMDISKILQRGDPLFW